MRSGAGVPLHRWPAVPANPQDLPDYTGVRARLLPVPQRAAAEACPRPRCIAGRAGDTRGTAWTAPSVSSDGRASPSKTCGCLPVGRRHPCHYPVSLLRDRESTRNAQSPKSTRDRPKPSITTEATSVFVAPWEKGSVTRGAGNQGISRESPDQEGGIAFASPLG